MPNYHIIECPRDAMQGWPQHIPTASKVAYINALLQVGFHTIDFGSFVSAKAIPQLADTALVLQQLTLQHTTTKLLAIVANTRGAQDAVQKSAISYLGYPLSVSPTFQQRNTNSTIPQALSTIAAIQELCVLHGKLLVVYLSMAFGNPYGDAYNADLLQAYTAPLQALGISIISLADTVGVATPTQISTALNALIPAYPTIQFGVHLHTTPQYKQAKLQAAIASGCTRIDGALGGIGGCPMATTELVGNMDTNDIINHLAQCATPPTLNLTALAQANALAQSIFTS